MAIRRGDDVNVNPRATDKVQDGDVLIVIGRPAAVNEVASLA